MYTVLTFDEEGKLKHIRQFINYDLLKADMNTEALKKPDWFQIVFKDVKTTIYKGREQLSMF